MATNNLFKSDLHLLFNFLQSSMIVYPKEMIITILRDFFSKDSYYHYSKDEWGFPNTVDHTNLPPAAGLYDDVTTRLFIGENFRNNQGIHYPSILIKNGGFKSVPISINREQGSVRYEEILYQDGYGNSKIIKRPKTLVTAGANEGSIIIDIKTRSLRSRDDLSELVYLCFTEVAFQTLYDSGIIVKPINVSGASETDDRNDKLFMQTLTLDIRTEWKREIPIKNIIDVITFAANIKSKYSKQPEEDFQIKTEVDLIDVLLNIFDE